MTTSTSKGPAIILASASPRRRAILRQLGIPFRISPVGFPEPPPGPGESAARYAVRMARTKALQCGRKHRAGLVIGADTVVVAAGRILGKPGTEQEARAMLRSLSGRWHEVTTGLCLVDGKRRMIRSGATTTRVRVRRLSSREIEWYIDSGEYRDKAGAYAIQGLAGLFIDRIEGCYFNVVGFPVSAFERLCRDLGIELTRIIRLNPT